jgi:predicted flap endonuclease-1-like 5' DNA nuclease
MKQVADLESGADVEPARECVTGVRDASGVQELDAPTQEIDLDLEASDVSAFATEIAPEPRPRKTSVPPPLPVDALRGRPTFVPPPPRSSGPPPLPSQRRTLSPSTPQPAAAPEVSELRAELDRLTKRMRERDAYLAELEDVYAQRSAALLKAEAELETLRGRLAEQQARIDALSQPSTARDVSPPTAADPAGTGSADDDLTRIRGIGPRYARILQGSGVRSFEQIAAWTPDDLLAIGRTLKITRGRIERDQWVEQARVLVKLTRPEA